MCSILEAEYHIAKDVGKNSLSSLKVHRLYKEAIDSAKADDNVSLEAYAAERAGMYFHKIGITSYFEDFMLQAHYCYDLWQNIAKVIHIESKSSWSCDGTKKRKEKWFL